MRTTIEPLPRPRQAVQATRDAVPAVHASMGRPDLERCAERLGCVCADCRVPNPGFGIPGLRIIILPEDG